MLQVDMDHRLLYQRAIDALLLEADQKWPFGNDSRQVAGIPALVLQEEVLVVRKAQHRHSLVCAAGRILAKEQRVFALQLGKFGDEGRHQANRIAKLRPELQDDAHIVMRHIVEHCVSRHRNSGG